LIQVTRIWIAKGRKLQNKPRIQMKQILIGCVVGADQYRWLEYGQSSALRTPLAGLMGFETPFCCEPKAESPPAAAIAKEFRPRADLNRRKAAAACPTGDRRIEDLANSDSANGVLSSLLRCNKGGRTRRAVLDG
jgi:hypothetical protein